MRIILLPFAFLCCLSPLQPVSGASRDRAESELRARAGQFYRLHVEGDFRAAEKLVCRESRNAFYAAGKQTYRSATVSSVVLADDLRSAEVVTLIEGEFSVGNDRQMMQAPVPSHWRHERQGWCYYIAPSTGPVVVQSPMGPMALGPPKPDAAPPATPAVDAKAVAGLSARIEFSKDTLRFRRQERSEDSIAIHNGLSGPVRIEVDCPMLRSFACGMDHAEILAGATARLSVVYDPSKASPGESQVRRLFLTVQPFRRQKAIAVLVE